MAVSADDQIAGAHQPTLGQQGVLHPAVAALIVVGDALLFRKFAADQHLIGRINVFLGREVIHDQGDFLPVENLFRAHAAKRLDGQRAGDVVGQHQGYPALNDLAVASHRLVGMGLQNFLCKRLRHVQAPP